MSLDRRVRHLSFWLLMISINVIAGVFVARMASDPERSLRVSIAASIDVTLVVSVLYYWMLVRPGFRDKSSIVVVALAGAIRAAYFFQDSQWIRPIVVGICEAALVGYVILQTRRGESLPFIGRLLETEWTILRYALFSWRAKPSVPEGAQPFTIYKRVGQADLFAMLPLVSLFEVIPVHLLLHRWSPLAAWIATGISIYGMIWLTGLARAFALRPSFLTADELVLRYGYLFEIRIPTESILRIRAAELSDQQYAVPRNSQPTVCVEFHEALEARKLFGIRRVMWAVAFTPDNGLPMIR